MQTSAHPTCLVTVKTLAAALSEWDLRYREDPAHFMSEAQHLLKETPETYGEAAGPYLMSILQEQLDADRLRTAVVIGTTNETEARTVEGEATREEAEQRLGCRNVVSFREPYTSHMSWARRCSSLSSFSRSISIADSSMTTCSGCARSLPPAPTVVLIGPQGCGKSTHAQAFAKALGCTHVIDGESLNGFDVDDPAAILREGALIIGPECAEDCPRADLVIEARTKAGFDKAVALLPSDA